MAFEVEKRLKFVFKQDERREIAEKCILQAPLSLRLRCKALQEPTSVHQSLSVDIKGTDHSSVPDASAAFSLGEGLFTRPDLCQIETTQTQTQPAPLSEGLAGSYQASQPLVSSKKHPRRKLGDCALVQTAYPVYLLEVDFTWKTYDAPSATGTDCSGNTFTATDLVDDTAYGGEGYIV